MSLHLPQEIANSADRVKVNTKLGVVTGGRASNGVAVFLEVPYALPPTRFEDPVPLSPEYNYGDKEFIYESAYAVQPDNDGQAAGMLREDKLGFGEPTENPLFLNIVTPASASPSSKLPVKVYFHGGFLQFGSPHHLAGQAQYIAEERNQVWVNVGYRLSAFGFLASANPRLDGNYGFKDQWCALQWIAENISAFGGNHEDIQITGLSAGAHSVHQILHHASRLPDGSRAPFQSAMLQSNAILMNPKTREELQPQFNALCKAVGLDPSSPDVAQVIRDPSRVSWQNLVMAVEGLGEYGTFRGCLDGEWLSTDPGPMAWQRSGGLADGLRRVGVKSVVVGDLKEEWYLYSIAHPIRTQEDVSINLKRYYPAPLVESLRATYRGLEEGASEDESARLFGEILSDGQVHVPVRVLAQDLERAGLPCLRYEINWAPAAARSLTKGFVTHGGDRPIWALRVPWLVPDEVAIARKWLEFLEAEVAKLEQDEPRLIPSDTILSLQEDGTIGFVKDKKYERYNELAKVWFSQ